MFLCIHYRTEDKMREKIEIERKLFATAWRDEKRKSRSRKKMFFVFLIQFGRIVVGAYCSLSGVVLCMLFHWTYNQYSFNYTVEFFMKKKSFCFIFYIFCWWLIVCGIFNFLLFIENRRAGFYSNHIDKPQL